MKKILSVLMFTFSMLLCGAQDSLNLSLSFNHMALSVKDVNVSSEFYSKVLQLKEITNRSKLEGVRWFSIGDGKELHLVSIVKGFIQTNKAIHLALTTENFDGVVKQLKSYHVVYSDWPGTTEKINIRADGIKQIFFQDPDGYWIEVNSASSH